LTAGPLLSVRNLGVRFVRPNGELCALDGVNLDLDASRTLAIVGESGSGKSVLARSILRLLPPSARIAPDAEVRFDGTDLLKLDPREMQAICGRRIALVVQDPMTALNPVRTIGSQLAEGMRLHLKLDASAARERALALLTQVGIPSPERRIGQYPHELSGGMRQRVVIAMAISCEPQLLIADEPTTALDVTVQAEILELLARLRRERRMTMILVTHDLGVAAAHTDEIAVMYAGQIVERAATARIFDAPRMPYTGALLRSIPRLDNPPHQPLATIAGRPPTIVGDRPGCHFADRCERVTEQCQRERPILVPDHDDTAHWLRCWRPLEAP
jgi:peptide/nickel transport system ATP-binding protein